MNNNLLKYIKNISICIFVFMFTFMLGNSNVYAKTAKDYDHVCKYTGHVTLYVYFKGNKSANNFKLDKLSVEVSGLAGINETGEEYTREAGGFVMDGNKMWCPSEVYYCQDATNGNADNHLTLLKTTCKRGGEVYYTASGSRGNVEPYVPLPTGDKGDKLKCQTGNDLGKYNQFIAMSKEVDTIVETFVCTEEVNKEWQEHKTNKNLDIIDNRAHSVQTLIDTSVHCVVRTSKKQKEMTDGVSNINTQWDKYKDLLEKCEYTSEETLNEVNEIGAGIQAAYSKLTIGSDVQDTEYNCDNLLDDDLKDVIQLVLKWVRIGAPILLIILTAVDFSQVVISDDQDAIKKAISKVIKRFLAALGLFFIPLFVSIMIDWIDNPENDFFDADASRCEEVFK